MKNRQVKQPRSYVGKVWSERLIVDKGLETRVYRMRCPRLTSLRHCTSGLFPGFGKQPGICHF